jgi:hypothetical protein
MRFLGGATYVSLNEPTDLPAGRFKTGPSVREGESAPVDETGRPILHDLNDDERSDATVVLVLVDMGEEDQIGAVTIVDRVRS